MCIVNRNYWFVLSIILILHLCLGISVESDGNHIGCLSTIY